MARIRIGLVGDHDAGVAAHRAVPLALAGAAEALGLQVEAAWLPTDAVDEAALAAFQGLWCVPASPYRSMEGALEAIRWARERGLPFLGTCGGFQHAVVEYARNVLGWADADHAETSPEAARPVISSLACALVETTATVRLRPGSRLAAAYGCTEAAETYRCRYGLNPAFREALASGPLVVAAEDEAGEVRALELEGHPFFVGTLFQPERAALWGGPVPPAAALLRACTAKRWDDRPATALPGLGAGRGGAARPRGVTVRHWVHSPEHPTCPIPARPRRRPPPSPSAACCCLP